MIDDRITICKNYLSGWFLIDFLSILPFELVLLLFASDMDKSVDSGNQNGSDVNGLMRIAKISKLYKLIKITRLIRLFKLMKNDGKVVK